MCPLRYVLLLLSLLVAMIGFTQVMAAEPDQISYKSANAEDDEEDEEARQEKSTMRTLVDMLNGKYLYDAWKASQGARIKTA